MSQPRIAISHPFAAGQDAELERWPGVTWAREIKGKHYALVLTFDGVSRFVIYAATPGDGSRGLLNHLRDVRATLIDMGAKRRVPIRTTQPKRKRNRTEPTRLKIVDRCEGGPKRDPWAGLAQLKVAEPPPVHEPQPMGSRSLWIGLIAIAAAAGAVAAGIFVALENLS